ECPATDLVAAGAPVSPATLFAALSMTMLARLTQWGGGQGFFSIRADWLTRATGIGEPARVRLTDREVEGRFEAVDPAGGLVLRLPDGSATIVTAGDVFMAAARAPAGWSGHPCPAPPTHPWSPRPAAPHRRTRVRAARRGRRDRHESRPLRLRRRAAPAMDRGRSRRRLCRRGAARHRPYPAGHPLSRGGAPQPARPRAHPRARGSLW